MTLLNPYLIQPVSDEATLTKAKTKELERKNEALKKEIHDILNDNPPNKGNNCKI